MTRVYTRSEWHALAPTSMGGLVSRPSPLAILHHTGAQGRTGPGEVKRVQNYHMNIARPSYRDIAYKRLADGAAVYEGRHLGTTDGATKGFNDRSASVCALGDFNLDHPSSSLLDNLAHAVVDLWRQGEVDLPAYDGGHRNYVATSCPGDHLHTQIPEINRRASLLTQETPVDAVLLIHPSVGPSDGLLGLTGMLLRPDQKVGVVCNADAARDALREGKRVHAIGGPACDLVKGDKDLRGVNRLDTGQKVLDQAARGW